MIVIGFQSIGMPTHSNISLMSPSSILIGARRAVSIPLHIAFNPLNICSVSPVNRPTMASTPPTINFLNPKTISSNAFSIALPNLSNPKNVRIKFKPSPSIPTRLPINPSNSAINPPLIPPTIPPSS